MARIDFDRHLDRERNTVERVATRYDKKATNFLGFVWVASLGLLLA